MATPDPFAGRNEGLDAPADNAVAITPHDSNDLVAQPRAVYVGGAGNLSVEMLDGSNAAANVTFTAVPAGTVLPIRPTKIRATDTTASLIVGMW